MAALKLKLRRETLFCQTDLVHNPSFAAVVMDYWIDDYNLVSLDTILTRVRTPVSQCLASACVALRAGRGTRGSADGGDGVAGAGDDGACGGKPGEFTVVLSCKACSSSQPVEAKLLEEPPHLVLPVPPQNPTPTGSMGAAVQSVRSATWGERSGGWGPASAWSRSSRSSS